MLIVAGLRKSALRATATQYSQTRSSSITPARSRTWFLNISTNDSRNVASPTQAPEGALINPRVASRADTLAGKVRCGGYGILGTAIDYQGGIDMIWRIARRNGCFLPSSRIVGSIQLPMLRFGAILVSAGGYRNAVDAVLGRLKQGCSSVQHSITLSVEANRRSTSCAVP
ncbi:hypothetical protein K431DRAFT_282176 [Polychaeton citri CBS 116435]|uniref:Uncharacterized protein n=1 Tax=Polychaeton citri CBS 116435 TaxID=1314669 RepID=A0A9P4UT34_9PEZI|nr:hypothetical protein K431DRAFT_282176 [Polychaeton citri CBS 116435]